MVFATIGLYLWGKAVREQIARGTFVQTEFPSAITVHHVRGPFSSAEEELILFYNGRIGNNDFVNIRKYTENKSTETENKSTETEKKRVRIFVSGISNLDAPDIVAQTNVPVELIKRNPTPHDAFVLAGDGIIVDGVFDRSVTAGNIADFVSEGRKGRADACALGKRAGYAKPFVIADITMGQERDMRKAGATVIKKSDLRDRNRIASLLGGDPLGTDLYYILRVLGYY